MPASDGSDWASQTSDADRLSQLRVRIAYLEAQLGPDMSSAPGSINFGSMVSHLEYLRKESKRLESIVSTEGVGFTRGRCI